MNVLRIASLAKRSVRNRRSHGHKSHCFSRAQHCCCFRHVLQDVSRTVPALFFVKRDESGLVAAMYGDDTTGEVMVPAAFQSRGLQHLQQGLLPRMHAD